MRYLFQKIYWTLHNKKNDFQVWFAKNFPFKIPRKFPKPPGQICLMCDKPRNILVAVDSGDGWLFFWECEEGCGEADEPIENWYPFCFGVWCKPKDLEKIGIEVV